MAVVWKLRRGTTDLTLNAAAAAGLRTENWNPKVAMPINNADPPSLVENIDLIADQTSHDNLASAVQSLDDMRLRADRYIRDKTETVPVWLHAKMDSETGERRALVRAIDMGWRSPMTDSKGMPAGNKAQLRVDIERAPWWEITAHTHSPRNSASETLGAAIIYDYTAAGLGVGAHDIVGDVPARIGALYVQSPAAGALVGRLWMGIRSTKTMEAPRVPSEFDPIRECENGTNGTDAADAVDATASNGNKVTVTPGTATWAKRLSLSLTQDPGTNYGAQLGDFLWLLRTKVSAGTWELQLRWGYSAMADDSYVRGPIVELTNTSWDYLEMGRMPVPLRDLHAFTLDIVNSSFDQSYTVQVWARRTVGAGTLDLDCIVCLPIDEGWLKSWNFTLTAADADDEWLFTEGPGGSIYCASYDGTTSLIQDFASAAYHNFRLPVGDGRMIIVYAGATSSDILNGIIVNPGDAGEYYERWANLRGAE